MRNSMHLYLFLTVFSVVIGLPVVIFLIRKDEREEVEQEQIEPELTNWEKKVLLAKAHRDVETYHPLLRDCRSNYQKSPELPKEMLDLIDDKIAIGDISPMKHLFFEDVLPSTPWASKDF